MTSPDADAHVPAWQGWRYQRAREFLTRLDPEADQFTFQTFDDTKAKRDDLARIMHGDFDRVAKNLDGMQQWRAGVFVAVNATDLRGRQAHNVERVRAVFVDLDGAPLAPVLAAGLEPHIVVESSPGRWHGYWLTDDCPLDQFERVQLALARRFNGDPTVHDLPRVMRLPGFRHFKGATQTCKLLDGIGTSAPPYTLAEIVGTLGLELDAPPERPKARSNGDSGKIAPGTRHAHLFALGRSMAKRSTREAVRAALAAENQSRCDPPLPDADLDYLAERAFTAKHAQGWQESPPRATEGEDRAAPDVKPHATDTEMELAATFTRRGAGSLLYVAGMDWFTNAGPRWQRDDRLARFTLANDLCRTAGNTARDSARNRIETNKTAAAIVNIARPDLIAVPADFDRLPYELNTPDGVIDLRHGTMRQRTTGDMFMHCTAVTPDMRGIKGTRFADFLEQITCGDASLARFLQTLLGAALFASNALEDHWLAFLVGSGRNGKGTLIEKCAARAMGSYARRVPAEVLLADDRGSRHPTEIANLVGCRLAYASEIDEGRRWNESRLKELSGGDKLSGRFMRQDLFEFVPSHRLVIYANHRPIIQNPDPAFRARLKLVPFNGSFVGREDTTLPDRLARELPRILGAMVAGAADYWEAGRLANCAAVDAASSAYFEMHATFDAWLEERCYIGVEHEARAKALYADFANWKKDRGEGVPSQTRWGETMGSRFNWRASNGIIWRGIGLRP